MRPAPTPRPRGSGAVRGLSRLPSAVRFRGRVGRKEIRPRRRPKSSNHRRRTGGVGESANTAIWCPAMDTFEIDTPHGPARAHVDAAPKPAGTLILGHGAGGGVEAVDIQAAAAVA